MYPVIQGWMSHFSWMGRRSGTSGIWIVPLGGRIWLNAAFWKAAKRRLWAIGSLDLKTAAWLWTRARAWGTNRQFFWSSSTLGALATSFLRASGFWPLGWRT